ILIIGIHNPIKTVGCLIEIFLLKITITQFKMILSLLACTQIQGIYLCEIRYAFAVPSFSEFVVCQLVIGRGYFGTLRMILYKVHQKGIGIQVKEFHRTNGMVI